ncbi:MAG: ImmA/IrrE family metallo-endopeptidase [Isosphaeraceae bacterium]
MIGRQDAIALSIANFPEGPEALARHLEIEVQYNDLVGLDGWCLRCNDRAIIQINKSVAQARQRFTLAHELAHLVLGTMPDLFADPSNHQRERNGDEREANRFASELLLPESIFCKLIEAVPVDSTVVSRVARKAKVSDIVVCRRLMDHYDKIGLECAAVIEFERGMFRADWSRVGPTKPKWAEYHDDPIGEATRLFQLAKARNPDCLREILVPGFTHACFYTEWNEVLSYLVIQVVDDCAAQEESAGEFQRRAENQLFGGDEQFRNQLNGCFGAFKNRISPEIDIDEAVDQFFERYSKRWDESRTRKFHSVVCQQYIRFRLKDLIS